MGIVNERQDSNADALENELTNEGQVPEKYKGKSLQDVIQMHQEAEAKASRLGNEVGQLRAIRSLEPKKEPVKKDVSVDDLLENPESAVETVINQAPVVRETREKIDQIEQDLHRQSFLTKYPDFKSDLSEDFYQWATSNQVRKAIAEEADKGNYQAATALWDMWSERKDLVDAQSKAEAKAKKEKEKAKALKDGMLESGNGSTTENTKIFSRREIQDLKYRAAMGERKAQSIVNDPVWQAEVHRAYAEGRAR